MPGTEVFGAEERKEVNDVMETGILFRYNHDEPRNGIWKAREMEKDLARFVGAKHCHMVSSGSTAVSTALAACGVGYGDEVIVPPFTYIATIEAVIYAGAVPVFAEIDETICMSPEGIEAVITPKTKAVLLVHMCGAIGRIEEIIALCERKNIMLIEDAAQALGASYKGKMAGLFGRMGTYSFDFFKIITCGEGGGIVTDDEQLYKNADMISDHGHDHIGNNRGMEGHPVLGINYRIGELNAAIGLAQLRKMPMILEKQRMHKAILMDCMKEFQGISFRHIPDEDGDSATFLSFFLPDEKLARNTMKSFAEEGVDGVQYWYDNHFHYYRNWEHLRGLKSTNLLPLHVLPKPQDYANVQFPKSDAVMSRLISMVVKVSWTEEQLINRVAALRRAFSKVFTNG